ncbi:MAG: beta strand repeat-containing protein [Burkholderiaceae bacterium]
MGTSGDDVITGVRAATVAAATDTLTAIDSVDGGAGTDTMTISSTAANTDATGGALIKNVEIFNLRQTATAADLALNAANTPGAETVNSYLSAGTVTVTGLASGSTLGLVGNNSITLGEVTGSYVATATDAKIAVSGGTGTTTADNINIDDGAGLRSVTIASSGAANTVAAINLGVDALGAAGTATNITNVTINADSNLTATGGITGIANDGTNNKISISGAATTVNIGTLDTDVDNVDASGLTAGGVNVTLSAAGQSVTGGAGNNTVNVGNLALTGTVKAGAGANDTVIFTASTNYATTATKLSGFETLAVRSAAGGDAYNFASIAGLSSIQIESAGTTTFNNVGADTPIRVTNNVTGQLAINLADTSGANTVNITIDDRDTTAGAITVGAINAAGVETLNLVTADALQIGTPHVVSALTGSTALTSVKVSGNSDLTITDATAPTGALTIDAAEFANRLTVGAAATSGISTGDTVKGGKGNDNVFVNFASLGTTTGFAGGAGDDTLTVIGDGSDVVDGDFAAITGVENLVITSTTNTTVTLAGFAQNAIASIDGNADGRLDITAATLTTGSTIDASALTTQGVDISVTLTSGGIVASTLNGGGVADTIAFNNVAAFANTTSINGGAGIDAITITGDALGVETIVTTATTLANGEIVTGFDSNTDKYDYNGTLQSAVAGNVTANATLNGAFGTAGDAVYIQTNGIANVSGNTQGSAFAAVLSSDLTSLASNYATLETQLLATGGALNGTFSNLDAAIANTNSALLVLDDGTGSIVLRITNSTATANTITADEIDLVGVFTDVAQFVAADFI